MIDLAAKKREPESPSATHSLNERGSSRDMTSSSMGMISRGGSSETDTRSPMTSSSSRTLSTTIDRRGTKRTENSIEGDDRDDLMREAMSSAFWTLALAMKMMFLMLELPPLELLSVMLELAEPSNRSILFTPCSIRRSWSDESRKPSRPIIAWSRTIVFSPLLASIASRRDFRA